MKRLANFVLVLSLLGIAVLIAQPLGPPQPVPDAKLKVKSEVSINEEGMYRYISTNGIPDHDPGRFPNRGNPNRISAQQYRFRIPLNPVKAPRLIDAGGMPFGVALNGVPFDPGTAELWHNNPDWRYDALSGKINLGLDSSNAHVQPNGAYHYHGLPLGLIKRITRENHMVLLGYAADGFPIYNQFGFSDPEDSKSPQVKLHSSYRLIRGNRPRGFNSPGGSYDGTFNQDYEYQADSGDLDECNGRVAVTPESDDPVYHYVISEEFPMIGRYFKGAPDASFLRRRHGSPPGGHRPPRGEHPPGRRPPPL